MNVPKRVKHRCKWPAQALNKYQGKQQTELALDDAGAGRAGLMGAIDRLNDRYGRGAVVMGSAGLAGDDRRWVMRQKRKTPDYTTRWTDMPVARA